VREHLDLAADVLPVVAPRSVRRVVRAPPA
jgi:hypothetical protein